MKLFYREKYRLFYADFTETQNNDDDEARGTKLEALSLYPSLL